MPALLDLCSKELFYKMQTRRQAFCCAGEPHCPRAPGQLQSPPQSGYPEELQQDGHAPRGAPHVLHKPLLHVRKPFESATNALTLLRSACSWPPDMCSLHRIASRAADAPRWSWTGCGITTCPSRWPPPPRSSAAPGNARSCRSGCAWWQPLACAACLPR